MYSTAAFLLFDTVISLNPHIVHPFTHSYRPLLLSADTEEFVWEVIQSEFVSPRVNL